MARRNKLQERRIKLSFRVKASWRGFAGSSSARMTASSAPLICLCLAAVAGCFLLAYLLYRRHADRQRRIANVLQRNLLKDKTKSAKKAKQDAKQLSTMKSRKDQEQELKKIRKKLQVASAKDLSKDKDAVADVLVANGFSEECAKHMADQVGQQGETTPSQTTEESEETAGSEGRPSGRTSRRSKKPAKAKKRLSVVGTEKDRELAEKLSGQIEKATTLQTTFTKANTGEKMKSKSAAFPEEHHAADGMPPVDLVQKFLAEKMEMKFDEDEHPTTAGGLTPPGTPDRGSLDSEDLLAGSSAASAARRTTQHPPSAGVVVTRTTSTTNTPAGTPRASTSTSGKNKKRSLSPLDQAASQVLGLFDDQGELVLNDGEVEACLVHTGISKQGAPKLAGAIRNIINSNKRLILTKKQVLEDNGDLLEGLPAADRKNLEMQMVDTKPDAAHLQRWFKRDAVGGQCIGRSLRKTPKKDPEEWLGQMLDDAEHREEVTRALRSNLMEKLDVGEAAALEMARAAVEFFCRTAWGVFRGLDPKQVKAGQRVVKGSVEKQVKVCDEEEAENGEDTFSQKNAEKKKLLVKLLQLDNSTNLFTKIAAKVQEFVEEGNRTEDTMGEALRKVVRDCIKEHVMGGESGAAAGAVKQSAAARECLAEIAQEIEEAFCVSAPKGGETVGSFLENPANFRVYEPDDAIVDAAARSMIFQKMATLKKAKEKSETIDLFAEPGGGSSKGAKVSASVGEKSFFTVPGAAPPTRHLLLDAVTEAEVAISTFCETCSSATFGCSGTWRSQYTGQQHAGVAGIVERDRNKQQDYTHIVEGAAGKASSGDRFWQWTSSGLWGAPERGAGPKNAAEKAPRARYLDDALSDCFPENARGLAEAVARSRNAIWTLQTRPGRGAYVAVILFSIFLRLRIGQHPHSGERTPPMYGDFEAQRHWIEVTSHVPLTDWYQGKTRHNELQFWGLDYPPLTAYHSWLIGKVYYALKDAFEDSRFSRSTSTSSSTSVDYFALFASRGDEHCKAFMRLACLFTDLLLYVTACCFYCEKVLRDEGLAPFPRLRLLAFFLLANAAPVLFIDHGHFQFNTVALGCVLWAVNCVYYERRYLGSVFYVCALLYKQTTLYYAPAFFLYLLGEALRDSFGGRGDAREREDIVLELVADWTHLDTLGIEEGLSPSSSGVDAVEGRGDVLEASARSRGRASSSQIAKIRLRTSGGGSSRRKKKPLSLFRFVFRIARLGVTVLFTAGLILYPFCRQLLQVKNRVFPFGRGIFEDYVGNLWALLSPVLKLRELTRDESSIYQTAAVTDEHGGSYLDFGQSALQGVIAEMSTAYHACSSEVFYTANSLGPRTAKAELASLASVKLAVVDMPLCISGNFLVPQLSALLSPEKVSTFAHGIILQVFQSPLLASKRQLIFALSLSLTLAGAFGAGFVSAFKKPNHRQFLRALIGSSLSFYLFSWQVHEKAILLPLLPVLLQLPLLWVDQISATSKAASCDVVWRNLGFLLFAHFSLLPLAYKDKNALLHFQLALFTLFLAAFFHGSGAPQEVRRRGQEHSLKA
eukprot:g5041.t1